MSTNNNAVNVGCSGLLSTLLTVLFVGLKLTGYITWSWWWVLAPLWISAIIGVVVLSVIVAVYLWVNQ